MVLRTTSVVLVNHFNLVAILHGYRLIQYRLLVYHFSVAPK
ncbi:hypothetical protein AOR13_2926 [Alteromonas stellipolaris LMG 21856]|nr:hypothetical protein AOR13_2926 [Alteromonas stellipolaris LMG 21856]